MTTTRENRPRSGRSREGRGRHARPRRGTAAAGLVVAAVLLNGAPPAWAGAAPAHSVTPPQQQSWLMRQIRKFRGYPHLDRAYRLMAQNRLAESRQALESYLAIDPDDGEARLSYAAVLYRLQAYEAAIAATEQVLQVRADHAGALITRALAQQALGRNDAAADGFRAVMRDASAPPSDRLFAARSLADLSVKAATADEALEALDLVASLDGEVVAQYAFQLRRALVLQGLGRLEEADAAFARAEAGTDAPDERLQALKMRGELAVKRGDFDARRAHFGAALALAPDDAWLMRALADTEAAAKRKPEAVQWLRRALAVRSSDDDRSFLAELLTQTGDHAGAEIEYTLLLAEPRPPSRRLRLHMSRGYARHARGLYAEALRDFQAAVAIRRTPQALEALANTQDAAGDRHAAADTLRLLVAKRPTAANHRRLGELLADLGDEAGAVGHLEAATTRGGSAALHARLGHLRARAGDAARALHHFERAAALGADGPVLFALGVTYAELGRDDAALRALERALSGGLDKAQRAQAWRQLGTLHARQGRDGVAAAALRRAVAEGDDGWQTRRALGYALARQGRHDQALPEFEAVAAARPSPEAALDLAFAFKALARNDEALMHFQHAAEEAERLLPSQRRSLYDELGHLHATRGERMAAAVAWTRAQALDPVPATALRLAGLHRELGELAAAERTLLSTTPQALAQGLQAAWWEERAQLHAARGDTGAAIEALEQADALDPTAERQFRIGLARRAAGHPREAVLHFETALARDPAGAPYAETLAYVYKDAGRPEEAAQLFRTALARQPRRVELQQDLAYTWLQAGRRDEAAAAFRRAIDLYQEAAAERPAAGAGDQVVQMKRLRQEMTELTRGDGFAVYQSYRPEDGRRAGDAGRGVLPSQGGLEYVHRIAPGAPLAPEVFGRLLWSAEPGRFAPDSDTLQGGLGARIKPLAEHDFYLSAERLVKVGSQAREDWLLRASYGWSAGYALRPGEASWNYTSLYLDAGHFTRGKGTTAYYGEVRQGWTFNVGDRLLVTPHVTVSGRHLNPDPFDDGYREGGGGVSLRYLFNESHYEAARSSAEFLLQYKRGIGRDSGAGGGWVFTAVLRF